MAVQKEARVAHVVDLSATTRVLELEPLESLDFVGGQYLIVNSGITLPELVTFDHISEAHPAAIAGALTDTAVAHHVGETAEHALAAHNAATLTALADAEG